MIKSEVKGYLLEVKWGGKVLDSVYIKNESAVESKKLQLILDNPECEIEILEVRG